MAFRGFLFLLSLITLLHGTGLEKVSVQFDWKYQFEYAGYIAAKEKGYYKEAGLEVELREYAQGIDVVSDVLNQKANYGVYNSALVVENTRLQPIVLMATYLQHSPLVFVTQKGIKNPADLVGKTIMATNNELKHSSLSLLLSHFDISASNTRFVDQTFSIDPFIDHKVDAMSVYRSNQLYELDKRNIPYDIIDPVEYGFVVNAGNLFTSHHEALQYPQRGQKFIDATNRGWKYALDHPDEIIEILKHQYGVKKSREALAYEAKVIKKLMMSDLYKIGETDGEFTIRLYKQLLHAGMIQEDQKLGQFLFQDIVASTKNSFQLSEAEKNYLLHKKKITMCVDPDWYPLEAIQGGKHVGIASDIMRGFASKLGTPIELIKTSTWNESLINAQNRKCDILSLAAKTSEREQYLNFTSTYLTLPYVLVTTMDKPFTERIDILHGQKLGIVKGYEIFSRLKTRYPELNIVEVESISDGLKKVENGQLYGYIDNLLVSSSYIQKEYAGNLKVSSRLEEKDELRVAVRNDEPMLHSIFEKLVVELDELSMQKSYNRWVSAIEQVRWLDPSLMGKIIGIIALFVIAFIWRYTLLKRYNTRLLVLSTTDKLTGLYNRQKIDEKLNEEQRKVKRYRDYHCAIMMIDVDYFKKINDEFGHQEGDKVLHELAKVMKKSLRQTDMIGRWGGEEFIIILSHTALDEAEKVAEHLRQKVADHPFTAHRKLVTLSIGVGEFAYNEVVHECVGRVDAALYRAKEYGRNKVNLAE